MRTPFFGAGAETEESPDILSSPDNMNGPATTSYIRCRAVSFCIRRERSGFCGLCVFHRKTLRFFSGRRSVCSPSQRLGDDLPFQIAGLIACAVDRLPLVALGRLVNDLGHRVVGFAAEFAAFKNYASGRQIHVVVARYDRAGPFDLQSRPVVGRGKLSARDRDLRAVGYIHRIKGIFRSRSICRR